MDESSLSRDEAQDMQPALAERLALVRSNVAQACRASGRAADSVTLIGVSKLKPVEMARAAFAAGLQDLGENYPQEAHKKAALLMGPRWHLIGNLQSNKVNMTCDFAGFVHSLDSLHIIQKMERRLNELQRTLPGLLQIRLGGESTKSGLDPEQVWPLLEQLALDPPQHLLLSGLMTIPPPAVNPEDNRKYFSQLRTILEKIIANRWPFWHGQELSMGMSADYEAAIKEGATMIRVGRAIFGARS